MLEIFSSAFVALFVVIDPPGIVPVFAALTDGNSAPHRRLMAFKGPIVAAVILLFFGLAGKPFLAALGISLDALRIAGGVMLFLIGLEMVFEKRTNRREDSAGRIAGERHDQHPHDPGEEEEGDDISVFPIAVPMLAGPGAIATMILLIAEHTGDPLGQSMVYAAMAVVLLMTILGFIAVGPLMRVLGKTVSTVLTRVLGIIVAALAAQFIVDGLRNSLLA